MGQGDNMIFMVFLRQMEGPHLDGYHPIPLLLTTAGILGVEKAT